MRNRNVAGIVFGLALAAWITLLPANGQAAVTTYIIDAEHTNVTFSIRHFFSKVTGRFAKFEGAILLDEEDYSTGSVTFTIATSSIDTNEPARDKHLRSDAFFDAENHPEITFESTSVTSVEGNHLKVVGDLSIRGITHATTLDVEVLGFGKVYSVRRAAFEIHTKISRDAFKVSWNDIVEGGGLLLGDEVDITINAEAKQQKPKPATE